MKKHTVIKRILSLLLALALVASYLPIIHRATAANATTGSVSDAFGQTGNKHADPHTLNNWKQFFNVDDPNNLNTAYAGGVWTDKSVFNSVAEYLAATDESDNNLPLSIDSDSFLVALSGIASTKSVEGYSSLPSDTILVLDLSASMVSNQAIPTLVASANDAISRLQELNANNRVGVVAYSGRATTGVSNVDTAEVILPLGRYTPGVNSSNQSAYLVSSWTTGSGYNRVNHTGVKVANGVTASVAAGVTSPFSTNNAKDAEGGTFVQNGLYQAWQQFSAVRDTIITEGIQAGVKRVPIMVLMSDGAATAATTDYTNVGNSNVGTGSSTYATNGLAFLTQLTASWVRDKMQQKYDNTPLFYTLGLNVGNSDAAKNLLDPSNNAGTDQLWNTFRERASAQNKNMNVTTNGNNQVSIQYTAPVGANWNEHYVTEYFPASNATAMGQAFSDIVQQIIIQSLYYPTMVDGGNSIDEDGFLVFNDFIGNNMEVKAIKGIQLGSNLYTGQTLARMIYQGGMGTVENPTDAGNNLVWSVQKRLGLATVQQARELIGKAYETGQFFYDPETGEFSNYIGWYADENEQFVAFWDGKDASPHAVPAEISGTAKYAIKSYGFYDAVGEGHRKTDMMYATIQVRTTVAPVSGYAAQVGDIQVIGKLPASLIPLVEFDIELNGVDVMNPNSITATGATAPSRLLYEVGLDSRIDLLDIAGTAPHALQTDTDGNYVFYTNQWHDRAGAFTYATNKNTLSYFEPSYENERYFYNYDTPIYVDRNGTLYTGATAPTYSDANTYYHRFITYYKENGRVRAQYDYEPISEHVLTGTGQHEHLTRQTDNTWVVNRGTLHHYFADYQINKTENTTDTLDVSFMPFTHDLEVSATTDHFHVDFYLGNNGKLILDPAEGIKVTKLTDDTITDKTADYRFTVTTDSGFNANLRLVKQDARGERTEGSITFTNGVANLSLKHGESAWILGSAMVGKTFTVTEEQGDGYVVSSVNGLATQSSAALPVTAGSIPAADFVNTKQHTGNVVIGKAVVSTLAEHANKEFSFTVAISGAALIPGREYTILRSDGQTFKVTSAAAATVTLKHNQYLTLSALPVGTTVTATEADYSGVGFTVNQAIQTATTQADVTKYLNFQNTYASRPVTVGTTVKVDGIKHLVSDTDLTATFAFKLERYIYADGSYDLEDESDVTYTASRGDKSFLFDFSGERFTAPGTYYYRISEVRGDALAAMGIIFDADPAFFSVVVTDDGEGNLYISDVVAGTDATVVGDVTAGWTVTSEFTNTYAVNGAAKVVLDIQKTIAKANGVAIAPAGFSFELYEADADFNITGTAPYAASPVTGAGGKSDIQLVYDDDATDIGNHYYVLKEYIPGDADKRAGVTYTNKSYGVKVDVGHSSGHFTVSVTTYTLAENTATVIGTYTGTGTEGVISVTTDALAFSNTYKAESVRATFDIQKTLVGKDLATTPFQYQMRQVFYDAAGNVDHYGNATYGDLIALKTEGILINEPGTSYWEITEVIPTNAVNNRYEGITYDPSVFMVKIDVVADDMNGKLISTVTTTKNGNPAPVHFVNTYTAEPVSASFAATKILNGGIRKLQANAFRFQLLDDAGNVLQTVGNGVPTGDYTAPVAFGAIEYTAPGTYTYTIREVLPAGATAQNGYTYHGITYDTHATTVTVVVVDNGLGSLTADVSYSDNAEFTNTYAVSPTSYVIRGEKTLVGDKLSNHAFTFELYGAYWDTTTQGVAQGRLITSMQSNANGEFAFGVGPFNQIGAYRYIVREQIPEDADPLMHYDTSWFVVELDVMDDLLGNLVVTPKITKIDPHGQVTEVREIAFTNTYAPEAIKVDLGGIKTFNLDLPAETFSFDLYQALAGSDGSINAVGDPILNAFNQADGTFTFREVEMVDQISGTVVMSSYLTFSQPGTYYFVVKENIPAEADANHVYKGVKYDATVYNLVVEVTQSNVDGRATLDYTMSVNGNDGGQLIFANTYTATSNETLVLSGKKILSGRDLADGEFKFGLYHATMDSTGKVTVGALVEEVTNADGKFTFSALKYPTLADAGYHFYVIREILPEGTDSSGVKGDITYDQKQYLVGVFVEDNGDGTLHVSEPAVLLVKEDGKISTTAETEIVFHNVYTAEPPKTGDTAKPNLWLMAFGLSVLSLGAVLVLGKKKVF